MIKIMVRKVMLFPNYLLMVLQHLTTFNSLMLKFNRRNKRHNFRVFLIYCKIYWLHSFYCRWDKYDPKIN